MSVAPRRVPFAMNEARVLIAGGTAGVGLATAKRFAALGAPHVTINGRNAERGETARMAVQELYPACKVHFVAADSCVTEQAVEVGRRAEELMGGVDVLVNSTVSAYPYPTLFHKIDINDIQGMVLSQVMPHFLLARAVMDGMRARENGAIINIASDAGKVTTPGETIIGGLMAAIMMFSRALAMEAKRSNIRINCVTPSIIEGTLTHDTVMGAEFSAKLFSKAIGMAQLGVVNAEDMAELITFLASPAAAKLTGQAISLNGGISAA
ncbi:SDR family NAD(P)-dependent oxidoreductase [Mesorhizobium sp. L-8-3]|uniref:SDR family NAD(P)-dependent oxidoreductase n=1 Tax=Mesorhizobium sp. L-8-3 TaxID=2744522 RepID=UPI001926E821|nr:SDR family oxidoreductase [Mesorhizobium sp. L-8-3]BCH23480.1 oxidoreductase [Mesorhizobium sp. L-8-3]